MIQIQDNGCLVNDIATAQGGKQMMMTPNGVRLTLNIHNGLLDLKHYYLTGRQMNKITREEFMTSDNTSVPTRLDDVEGASILMISQFPPIFSDAIDSFYNDQGDIRAKKSDSKVDPAVVDSEFDSVFVDNNEQYHPNLLGLKVKDTNQNLKKRNQQKWINNKKIRWKDQPKASSLSAYLLQKNYPLIEVVPSAFPKITKFTS